MPDGDDLTWRVMPDGDDWCVGPTLPFWAPAARVAPSRGQFPMPDDDVDAKGAQALGE